MLGHVLQLMPVKETPSPRGTVLVADDDAVMIDLLCRIVQTVPGVSRMEAACDGASALDQATSHAGQIGVMVLDIGMPGLNGFEVCSRFRRIPELTDLPIILITARPTSEIIEQARSCGATFLVSKPFVIEILRQLVALCLAGHPHPQGLADVSRIPLHSN